MVGWAINKRHFTLIGLTGWVGFAMAANPRRLLVLGDSISAEYGLSRGSGWVALLQKKLEQEQRPWTVINASISGDTTSGGRSRLPALLKSHQPDLVVIELGGNDALRGLSLEMSSENVQQMIDAARQAGAQVLLVGMQVPPNYGPDYSRQFSQMYQRLAQKNKIRWLPFFFKGLADVPDASAWFQADRIHPNEQAQPKLLNNLWPELKPLL
jgi:acyl-CoA thioesterase-1